MRKVSPSEVRFDRLAILLGSQNGFAVTVAKRNSRFSGGQIEAERNAVERGAAGEREQGKRQEQLAHD